MKYSKMFLTAFFIIVLPHIYGQENILEYAILNANVIDGTGKPAYHANIYIDDDAIAYIDRTDKPFRTASHTIQANGMTLTPGFIDLHSHGAPKSSNSFKNFLAMGVTTISLGQDGSSPKTRELLKWREEVNAHGTGVNIAQFIGHGTLRTLAGVGQHTKISDLQMATMSEILRENMSVVFGMSTGLEYSPALYASAEELLTLAKIVGEHGKLIMSHMRNEDDDALIESINELIAQGQFTKVHIAHLKSVYGKGAKRAEEILSHIYQARKKGIAITADVYPYNASYTGIAIVFPDWAKSKTQLEVAKIKRRPELEAFIINKVNSRNGPEAVLFGTAPYTGMTLAQVSKQLNKPFEQVLIDDIDIESVSGAYFVMNEALQTRLISDPLISLSSDGSATSFHPRGHGTFAKLIETLVIEKKLFTLEEAVHKVTQKAADTLGIIDRGQIKTGYKADLLLFNPSEIKAKATYVAPHQLAEGFKYVWVNGKLAIRSGQISNQLHGYVLLPEH